MLSASIQQFVDGFCRSVSIGTHWSSFHRCWCENKRSVLPWSSPNAKISTHINKFSDYFTSQQDLAPAHRTKETVYLLKRETPDFIPPSLWPSNSPDLNPVDYKTWGLLQQWVYSPKIQNVDELWQRIVEEWERLDQRVIDNAVKQWRKRLCSWMAAKGGYFEQML